MLVVRYGAGEWGVGELWFRTACRCGTSCRPVRWIARTPGAGRIERPNKNASQARFTPG